MIKCLQYFGDDENDCPEDNAVNNRLFGGERKTADKAGGYIRGDGKRNWGENKTYGEDDVKRLMFADGFNNKVAKIHK